MPATDDQVDPVGTGYTDDTWLKLSEAAEVMRVSYWTAATWTARGEFCPDAIKLPNGQWRVRYGDLTRWMRTMRQP